MTLNLSMPKSQQYEIKPRITVVGVGGAGGNAVNNMIRSNLEGVEFIVSNTDAQALAQSICDRRLQLGINITQGLGAGSRPDVGRAAAEEVMDQLMAELDGSNMVFITAGMGGGTGTGAAPVIARAAREHGILTVGVVTKPFHFEGTHRMKIAESGINELQQFVDTLIIIPNQNLFRVANEKTTFADAFAMADQVLYSGVACITDLMVKEGLINLDFADVRAVMREMGSAMMGTGEASGDRRALLSAEAAIANPLIYDVSMRGARGVLISITGGRDLTLFEVDQAANRIREEVDPDANIIFGSTFDERLAGKMRISVVATGIDVAASAQLRPLLSLVGDRDAPQPATIGAAAGQAAPLPGALPIAASTASPNGGEPAEPTPAVAQVAESAAIRDGAFIVPRPVEPANARPQAAAPSMASDAFAAAAMENGGRPVAKAKPRGPSLFERVTGVARNRSAAPAERPKAPAATAAPAQQQRLGALDPSDRLVGSKSEEDLLDIPAFLRRQAN